MSLLLVLLETPRATEEDIVIPEIATFCVRARLSNDRIIRTAVAVTDGVASDRFVTYGNTLAGREGAKMRRALLEFLRVRQHRGNRLFLKLLAPRGQIGTVVFDVRMVEKCSLGQLRSRLKSLQPASTIEILEHPPHIDNIPHKLG